MFLLCSVCCFKHVEVTSPLKRRPFHLLDGSGLFEEQTQKDRLAPTHQHYSTSLDLAFPDGDAMSGLGAPEINIVKAPQDQKREDDDLQGQHELGEEGRLAVGGQLTGNPR